MHEAAMLGRILCSNVVSNVVNNVVPRTPYLDEQVREARQPRLRSRRRLAAQLCHRLPPCPHVQPEQRQLVRVRAGLELTAAVGIIHEGCNCKPGLGAARPVSLQLHQGLSMRVAAVGRCSPCAGPSWRRTACDCSSSAAAASEASGVMTGAQTVTHTNDGRKWMQ